MSKFKIGDRVVDTSTDPLEYGTVRYYSAGLPYILWENGEDAGNICWTLESNLELVERKEVIVKTQYKFIDHNDADTSVEVISKSGKFKTKKSSADVFYTFGLDGIQHVELGIHSQCFEVEDLEQLKAFIEFSIDKLKAAKAEQE